MSSSLYSALSGLMSLISSFVSGIFSIQFPGLNISLGGFIVGLFMFAFGIRLIRFFTGGAVGSDENISVRINKR